MPACPRHGPHLRCNYPKPVPVRPSLCFVSLSTLLPRTIPSCEPDLIWMGMTAPPALVASQPRPFCPLHPLNSGPSPLPVLSHVILTFPDVDGHGGYCPAVNLQSWFAANSHQHQICAADPYQTPTQLFSLPRLSLSSPTLHGPTGAPCRRAAGQRIPRNPAIPKHSSPRPRCSKPLLLDFLLGLTRRAAWIWGGGPFDRPGLTDVR